MNECECDECSPRCNQYADLGEAECYDCESGIHRPERDD